MRVKFVGAEARKMTDQDSKLKHDVAHACLLRGNPAIPKAAGKACQRQVGVGGEQQLIK